jgi:hypothetical protein
VDADGSLAVPGRNQPLLDGEGSDAGQDISAILRDIDPGLVDHDLQEEVVDIGVIPGRARDHGDLAG